MKWVVKKVITWGFLLRVLNIPENCLNIEICRKGIIKSIWKVHPRGDIKFFISLYTWNILFVICVVHIFSTRLKDAYKAQKS